MEGCVICGNVTTEALIKVTQRGKISLIEYSRIRGREDIINTLNADGEIYVHENCRKWYNNKKRLASTLSNKEQKKPKTRKTSTFNWKANCFLCGKEVQAARKQWHLAQTFQIKNSILENCETRLKDSSGDKWAIEVKGRLNDCADFIAAEARYHKDCRTIFSTEGKHLNSRRKSGRPSNTNLQIAFDKTCIWLDNEVEVHSVSEFIKKMCEYNEKDTYTNRHIKQLLKDRYKDHVSFVSTGSGKENIISFQNTTHYLIKEKFQEKDNIDDEKKRMISIVGNLIKSEIREKVQSDNYPSPEHLSDEKFHEDWIPESLDTLLKILIPNFTKRIGIGHAVVSACRHRLHSPLLFGLGVQLDHCFGSKWLITQLSRFGFSASYDEVRSFKQSVIEQGDVLPIIPKGSFVQWVGDNVDHNTRTIDGKDTFHGMGIIAAVTPSLRSDSLQKYTRKQIIYKKKVKDSTLNKGVPIVEYFGKAVCGELLKFKPYTSLSIAEEFVRDNDNVYDMMWLSNWLTPNNNVEKTNWSGYMQKLFSKKKEYNKSTVLMLPLIDMQPSDPTCIYSTLSYVEKQAKHLGITVPAVTFDQPLWLKANAIVQEKNMNILCRLGGFHLLMSFLASIGDLMRGSGIEDILKEVYAENVIPHLLSGKAYSRALRAHMLLHLVLLQILYELLIDQEKITIKELEILSDFKTYDTNNAELLEAVKKISSAMEGLKISFQDYRTARLWLNYIDYINIVKLYIRAERTGDWLLHLYAVKQTLNLFAATGHLHYAKSARLYLQQMLDLPNTHPDLYHNFMKGLHTIRRSDRFWAGIWSDLTIEQYMMRSIKSRGGLTRGRGFSDSVRHQWVYTTHQCAAINDAMSSLSKAKCASSEQHIEMGNARKARDDNDRKMFYTWVKEHNPFIKDDERLKSLSTGMIATNKFKINCDDAENVGRLIQSKLDNVPIADAKIKRKDRVLCLDSLCDSILIEKKPVQINPTVLFNRLSALVGREENVEKYFDFELTTYPMSIFKDALMRKPDKASLRKAIFLEETQTKSITKNKVIDGCALLHKLHWAKDTSFGSVLTHYVRSVKLNYGFCCVVFDGYSLASIKDHEHRRRCNKAAGIEIKFDRSTLIRSSREDFLSNSKNKSAFISQLSHLLEADGQEVLLSKSDADTDIVKVAIMKAEENEVEVIADDTDIAMLLLHHWKDSLQNIILTSEISKKSWSIREVASNVDPGIKNNILLIHAISGCDTTSAIFGIGKPTILKYFKALTLQAMGQEFLEAWSSQEDIGAIGIKIIIRVYGGKEHDTLRSLRYAKFQDMAAKGVIDPSKLPPTERAAHFHCLRVHFQVLVWETLDQFWTDPLEWGWSIGEDNVFTPIQTDSECAPPNILNFVRCKCKTGCGTNRCSCKRQGLVCVAACKNCRGDCENGHEKLNDIIDDEEDDDNFDNIFDILSA